MRAICITPNDFRSLRDAINVAIVLTKNSNLPDAIQANGDLWRIHRLLWDLDNGSIGGPIAVVRKVPDVPEEKLEVQPLVDPLADAELSRQNEGVF